MSEIVPDATEPQADPAPEPAPAAEPATPEVREWEYQGEKLRQNEVDYLIGFGLDAYKKGVAESQKKQAPEAPAAPITNGPGQPAGEISLAQFQEQLSQVQNMIQQNTQRLDTADQTARAKAMSDSFLDAYKGNEFFRAFDDKPKLKEKWIAMIGAQMIGNPRMSAVDAAKSVAEGFGEIFAAEKQAFAAEKIQAGKKQVDKKGGGSPSTAVEKFTKDDINSGKVFASALARAQAAAAS
jgi:hypothetical protein